MRGLCQINFFYQILGGSDNVLFIQRDIADVASWPGELIR